jgi:hypothetical protein
VVFNQLTPQPQTALETMRQKWLQAAYDKACKEDKETEKKLVKATEACSNYQGKDENPPEKSLKKATEAKNAHAKP